VKCCRPASTARGNGLNQNLADFTDLSIKDAVTHISKLKLNKREATIARDSMQELISRLSFLDEVGLSYLQLNRAAPTLSGGEAQRIRLAAIIACC